MSNVAQGSNSTQPTAPGALGNARAQQIIHRKSNVYGHNGLIPGQWFANRNSAFHWVAIGQRQVGVDPGAAGAFAVVANFSGKYRNLNIDGGNTIEFAQTGAHKAIDRTNVFHEPKLERFVKALRRSHSNGKPIRGLSKANAKTALRYDGLYTVTHITRELNTNKGLYERFTLTRLPQTDSQGRVVQDSLTNVQQLATTHGNKEGLPPSPQPSGSHYNTLSAPIVMLGPQGQHNCKCWKAGSDLSLAAAGDEDDGKDDDQEDGNIEEADESSDEEAEEDEAEEGDETQGNE